MEGEVIVALNRYFLVESGTHSHNIEMQKNRDRSHANSRQS